MNLKERIKSDVVTSLKNKEKERKMILSTLLGELDRIDKNPTDDIVIKTIKKMIENNILTNCSNENKYLETYLPTQMTDDDLEKVLENYIDVENLNGMKSMGKIMQFMNNKYSGLFNGKKVSEISKKYL